MAQRKREKMNGRNKRKKIAAEKEGEVEARQSGSTRRGSQGCSCGGMTWLVLRIYIYESLDGLSLSVCMCCTYIAGPSLPDNGTPRVESFFSLAVAAASNLRCESMLLLLLLMHVESVDERERESKRLADTYRFVRPFSVSGGKKRIHAREREGREGRMYTACVKSYRILG